MHSTGGHSKEVDRQSHKLREMIVSVRQNTAILIWLRKETPESAAELLVLLWLTERQHRKHKSAQQLNHRSASCNHMSTDQ